MKKAFPFFLSFCILLSSCSRTEYRLEWNESNRTDVPYEVSFDVKKMKGKNWNVYADAKLISSETLNNGRASELCLRFNVPEGTKRLSMKRVSKSVEKLSSDTVDNLFQGAVWIPDEHCAVASNNSNAILQSKDFEVGYVRASVNLPDFGKALSQSEYRGVPVQAEFDVRGLSKVTFPVKIYFRQYDKDDREIPDDICDARWTSGFIPWKRSENDAYTQFRTTGYIHPLACRIEAVVEFHPCRNEFGRDGLRIDNPNDNLPMLEIARLAMRPANVIPFPHYDDSLFSEGISDADYDTSLTFDGSLGFWFCTRTWGNWAKGAQFRDPASFNFPDKEGTVEAWFYPEWNEDEDLFVPLFEASHYNSLGTKYGRFALGKCLALSYNPAKKSLHLLVRDPMRKRFDKKTTVDIAQGKWSHIAVTFVADKYASVYLNGVKSLEMPLPGWHFVDNEKEENVNDRYPSEFHLGCSYVNTCNGSRTNKISSRRPGALQPELRVYHVFDTTDTIFKGKADLLRISRLPRYKSDFTPEKTFKLDDYTCALFDFNHSFDGRSSGTSLGIVPATVFVKKPLQVHKLGDIQYYPDTIAFENDPVRSVLKRNFLNVPDTIEFNRSYKTDCQSFDVKVGEKFTVSVPEGVMTDYVEIENTGNDILEYPIVMGKDDIDYRSYEDIRRTLKLKGLTQRQIADKILAYANNRTDYYMNYPAYFAPDSDEAVCLSGNTPGTWGAHFTGSQALIHLNGYVGMECGPLNRIASALYSNVGGLPAEECCGYGHEFQQVYYDGKWHIYDQSGQTYYAAMDYETAVSLEEADREPQVFDRQGRTPGPYIRQGYRTVDANTVFYHEKTAAYLRPQEKVRLWTSNNGVGVDIQTQRKLVENDMIPRWDIGNYPFYDYADSCHAYGYDPIYRIDRLFPQYANGELLWKGKPSTDNPAFVRIESGSFCFRVWSPLPIVAAEYSAINNGGKQIPLEISTDGGKTFREFKSPATYSVRCRMAYYIKVKSNIEDVKEFEAKTLFVVNPRILTGNLRPGRNKMELVANSGFEARVTWQYRTPGKDIVFEGALNHGTIPGFEHSTIFLNPETDPVEVRISGLSSIQSDKSHPSVVYVSDSLKAVLSENNGHTCLVLSSVKRSAGFGWVTVKDGDYEKTLCIASVPGCRVIKADKIFRTKNDSLHLEFAPVPAGEYTLLHLDRFPSNCPIVRALAVNMKYKGVTYPAICEANSACDFLKQSYGSFEKESRGRWKWEYLIDYRFEFPFFGFKSIKLDGENNCLDYQYIAIDEVGPVELDSVILIPYPSLDFKRQIFENLISVNHRPWIMN